MTLSANDSVWLVGEHPLEDRLILISRAVETVTRKQMTTVGLAGDRVVHRWRTHGGAVGWSPRMHELPELAIDAYIEARNADIERAEATIKLARRDIARAKELRGR